MNEKNNTALKAEIEMKEWSMAQMSARIEKLNRFINNYYVQLVRIGEAYNDTASDVKRLRELLKQSEVSEPASVI